MIKANELRIDNWLLVEYGDNDREPEQITWINDDSGYEDYYPIPLTPEILEKVGFVREATLADYVSGESKSINLAYRMDGYDCDLILRDSIGHGNEFQVWASFKTNLVHIGAPIYYVHQLQNLYFCLCGEELNINL